DPDSPGCLFHPRCSATRNKVARVLRQAPVYAARHLVLQASRLPALRQLLSLSCQIQSCWTTNLWGQAASIRLPCWKCPADYLAEQADLPARKARLQRRTAPRGSTQDGASDMRRLYACSSLG